MRNKPEATCFLRILVLSNYNNSACTKLDRCLIRGGHYLCKFQGKSVRKSRDHFSLIAGQ